MHDEQDEILNPANAAKAFDQVYINGRFVIPHGRQLADLANPANNEAFGKVTLADEIDIRKRRCCCKGGVQSVFASDRLVNLGQKENTGAIVQSARVAPFVGMVPVSPCKRAIRLLLSTAESLAQGGNSAACNPDSLLDVLASDGTMKRGKAETEFNGSFVGLAFETRLNRAFGKFLDSLGDVLCIDPGSVVQKGEKHVTRAFGVEDAVFDAQKMIGPEVKTTPIGKFANRNFSSIETRCRTSLSVW